MKLIKIFLWCVTLFVLSGVVYISVVISEVHQKLTDVEVSYEEKTKEESILETGTLVKKRDLLDYLNFTDIKSKDSFLRQLIDNESLRRSGTNFLVDKEVTLPRLIKNDCKRYNCIKFNASFDDISPLLWKGLIGIEDYRFLEHDGVDYRSLLRAFVADVKAMKKVQGGSTLTMQLAKNLFLTNEKRFERKLREMVYAFYIEYKLSKEEIITTYFNEIFWGVVDGVYIKGIKAASIAYFNKSPKDLTDFEASMLIGMLKGPYFYNPFRHFDRLQSRTAVVYKRLSELSLVGDTSSNRWNEKIWQSWIKKLTSKNEGSSLKSFYFLSKTLNNYLEPYEKYVFYQSVRKINNLLSLQTKDLDVATKFIAIDINCTDKNCPNSFYYYSKNERDLDKAIFSEQHQVGSVLKPIIYEQLIELGKSLDDKVSTDPITLDLVSGKWTPKDGSEVHVDEVDLRYAVKKSKNIPLIRVASEVGFDELEPKLLDYFPNLLTPLAQYPAQLLGSVELSLGELSFAYLKYFKKTCQNIKDGKYAFEDSILFEMSNAKETTISRVSLGAIKEIMMFGKTGTTNKGLDNWYVAFDGKVFYAIWYGVDSQRAGKTLRLAGATSAFRIFQNFQLYRGKQLYELYCHDTMNEI